MGARFWYAATGILVAGATVGLGTLMLAPMDTRSAKTVAALPERPPSAISKAAKTRPAEKPPQKTPAGQEITPEERYQPLVEAATRVPELPPLKAAPPDAPEITRKPEPPAVPPWVANAVPFTPDGNKPLISIVIDDVGLSRARTEQLAKLQGPITIAFLTYAEHLQEQADMVRQLGHETIVHFPMEPSAGQDPGPNALLTRLPEQEIRRRLKWGLSRFEGFVGFNNHMGSKFTSDRSKMRLVAEAARERGLLYLDSVTSAASTGWETAHDAGVPTVKRDIFLDNDSSFEPILVQLGRVEQVARENGSAIAIGHPHEATIEALNQWLEEIRGRGFQLAPLSAVVRYRMTGKGTGG
jgi:polysaccharide deacetylase 2 family uncharacterized protein YibQ